MGRARHLLNQGKWEQAFQIMAPYQHQKLSTRSQKKIHLVLAECHHVAGQQYLSEKEYEKALESFRHAAELRGKPPEQARDKVVHAMLEEIRRRFASTTDSDTGSIQDLISRTLLVQAACPEAAFWQALCFVREKNIDTAIVTLKRLVEGADPNQEWSFTTAAPAAERFIDPPLYLGALLLQQGHARDSLRYLTEANRIDSNCLAVTCQLGTAILGSGGDPQFAVRALQRALGPRGFALWSAAPEKFWVEGFPQGRSYVRRLAEKFPYHCPLWGRDYTLLQRRGNTALAEGLYRLGQYEQAAAIYDKLVHESAPSIAVLRGLGLSLVKLERYDQAFKHLRAAHELEQPKTQLTAGYLALCGARGKPSSPEDKLNNVAWAIWLVRGFQAYGDPEWVDLLNQIFAEARSCGMKIELADQLHLCEHLLSIHRADPLAAGAYHHLAATYPESLRPEYAWLYCRAAQQHHLEDEFSLDLFARTFRDREQASPFFSSQGWNFDDLEYTFLAQAAAQQTGRFPEVLGEDYAPRGEKLLLDRASQMQARGDMPGAQAALEILVKLAPRNAAAHDRLAQLYHQGGQPDLAIELLQSWHNLEPLAPTPLQRLTVLYHLQGQQEQMLASIKKVLSLTTGAAKAKLAFLGARLTAAHLLLQQDSGKIGERVVEECLSLLEICLKEDPHQHQARWLLATVYCLRGDLAALAKQAAFMDQPEVQDPSYHLLAAICQLAAKDWAKLLQACRRAGTDSRLLPECEYLLGLASLDRGDLQTAAGYLERVARSDSPSASHAKALAGTVHFSQREYGPAVENWKSLDKQLLSQWQLQQPLAGVVFLAALQALQKEDYQEAAAQIRLAGRHGLKDRRLGPLLSLALLKAGQKLLYQTTEQ